MELEVRRDRALSLYQTGPTLYHCDGGLLREHLSPVHELFVDSVFCIKSSVLSLVVVFLVALTT